MNLAGNLFDRQSYVGVITPVGAFTAGRQYTPAYLTSANFDASQTQSSLAAGQVASLPAAFDIRLSNTLPVRHSNRWRDRNPECTVLAKSRATARQVASWAPWLCTRRRCLQPVLATTPAKMNWARSH